VGRIWRVWCSAALILGALACATPAAAQTTPATCPSTFAVLHDDRIGELELAAGHYTITVVDPARLSCAHAADLFRQFLEDFDGRLPRPWTLDAESATFSRSAAIGFGVALAAAPSGGGDGGHHPSGTTCPAYFHVLHDDVIGALELPEGEYRLTLLAVGRLSCSQAAARFADFLADFDGRLPGRWVLDPQTATFSRGAHVGFRVKLAAGEPDRADPAGIHPTGRRCRGTFRVQNDDRIGRLRLPAGRYRITRLRPSALTCAAAVELWPSSSSIRRATSRRPGCSRCSRRRSPAAGPVASASASSPPRCSSGRRSCAASPTARSTSSSAAGTGRARAPAGGS
jgi:hypothetical protein